MTYDNYVWKGALEKLKNDGTLVTVHMKNGFPVRGKIARFDDRVIVLNDYGVEKLLYQGAVSTISPSAPPRQHYVDAAWGGGTS